MSELSIREATPADVPVIARFVRALAEYEKLAHEAVGTEADFHAAIFGTPQRAGCLVAEWEGEPAAIALYHWTFSTFLAKPGRWLEDLWVEPQFRRRGIARALFARAYPVASSAARSIRRRVMAGDRMGSPTATERIARAISSGGESFSRKPTAPAEANDETSVQYIKSRKQTPTRPRKNCKASFNRTHSG